MTYALPKAESDLFGSRRRKTAHDANQHLASVFHERFDTKLATIHAGKKEASLDTKAEEGFEGALLMIVELDKIA